MHLHLKYHTLLKKTPSILSNGIQTFNKRDGYFSLVLPVPLATEHYSCSFSCSHTVCPVTRSLLCDPQELDKTTCKSPNTAFNIGDNSGDATVGLNIRYEACCNSVFLLFCFRQHSGVGMWLGLLSSCQSCACSVD